MSVVRVGNRLPRGEGRGEDLADDHGIGVFQLIELRAQVRFVLRHIEHLGDAEDLADVVGILGDEQAGRTGDGGQAPEGVQSEMTPERGRGFRGIEMLEPEKVRRHGVALGQFLGREVDAQAAGEIRLGGGAERDADADAVRAPRSGRSR